ncbi:alpha/beta hydrolase [Amycolatopsis sp. NPDC059657]|uniref:alpha/beta hydrolase n=1 Tax=Amycolatopsis sp. NPDC059657 TaxID=3346899 RepID=UPI003671BDF0
MADALNQRCQALIATNDDVESAIVREGWMGNAAVAAGQRGRSLISGLEQRVAEASAVRRAAHEVQLAVERIAEFVLQTDELARVNGWHVGGDGAVVRPPTAGPPPPPDVVAKQARVKVELADRVEQILRRAADVDADFAAILTKAMSGEITEQDATSLAQAADAGTRQSGLSIIGPPEGGTPGDNKAWWASLSDTAKATILRDNPDLVRNLDGIPVVDRDSANRAVLQREIGKLETKKAELTRGNLGDAGKAALDEITAKLKGLHNIDNRLNRPDNGQPQAFLIGLDIAGDGKAIVSSGNPDTAKNVATYVPGTGSGLASIGDDVNRSDRMVAAATKAGSPSTAVVTWMGYDAPNELPNAGSESYADNGKGALAGFQDGLRATHDGDTPSHNTVLGHSYGSTVIGHAAREGGGLNADELAFVGSPGVGVDSANELHLRGVDQAQVGQHVHSTVAEHDIIKVTNLEVGDEGLDIALGPDPATAQFGGQVFSSDAGTSGPIYQGGLSKEAHSEYWNPNSKSLGNIGLIIAGKPTS